MARITVTVCDMCKDPTKEASTWTVINPNGIRKRVDLCDSDSESLQTVFDIVAKPGRSKRSPSTGKRGIELTTPEEIQKLKK